MKDVTGDALGAPKVVDRSTFQAELDACAFERRPTHGKATRLQPRAGGFPWSRWMARRRSSASVG